MKKFIIYGILSLVMMAHAILIFGQNESYLQGIALLQQKSYDEAAVCFKKALQEEGPSVRTLLSEGEALFNLGLFNDARSSFLQANEMEPGVSNIWLARCHARQNQTTEAIRYLRTHLESDRKLPEKTILADPSFRSIEKSREWRSLWGQDWYSPSDYQRVEAEYLMSKGQYSDALSILDILIAKKDDDAYLYGLRGQAHAAKNDLKQGIRDLNQAIMLNHEMAEFYEVRARIYLQSNQLVEAIQDLTEAMSIAPEKFYIWLERARTYEKMNELDRAKKDVDQYLEYFHTDVQVMLYASELSMKSNRYFDALSDLNKGLEINPGKEDLYIKRGEVYLKTETYAYAEHDFTMALDLNPFNGSTYFNRGQARLKLDKRQAACYDFNKAFQMGKKEALEYLQDHCDY